MTFNPKAGDEIIIDGKIYRIAPHPAFYDMPYGQEGRQGTVYKLISVQDGQSKALKVFRAAFRHPANVYVADQLASIARVEGLQVCERTVLTPQNNMELLGTYPDLLYAVLMPWIKGPTWTDILLEQGDFGADTSLHTARSLAEVLSYMEQRGLAHCDLSGPNVMIPGLLHDITPAVKSWVQLIDIEQIYASQLDKPEHLSKGSPGYASIRPGHQPMWNKYADRFAGGVLIAEMLAWFDPEIRSHSWGESYFDPERMQEDEQRAELLTEVLKRTYGSEVAALFRQVWDSDDLLRCPTFGEWYITLSLIKRPGMQQLTGVMPAVEADAAPQAPANGESAEAEAQPQEEAVSPPSTAGSWPETENAGPRTGFLGDDNSRVLEEARELERRGELAPALAAYNSLLDKMPEASPIRYEIQMAARGVAEELQRLEAIRLAEEAARTAPPRSKLRYIIAAAAVVILGGGIAAYAMLGKEDDSKLVAAADPVEAVHDTEEPVKAEPEPEPEPVPEPEPKPEVKPDPKPVVKEEPKKQAAEPQPAQAAEPESKPQPVKEPVKVTQQPAPAAQPKPTKQPAPAKPAAKQSTENSQAKKIKQLEESIQYAFNVEDDTEKVIRLSKQLKAIDPNNAVARQMLSDLTGE
ncbi:hypothetical protein DNH61_16590 [Paenibacillus sambharensis]|uniref:Protein kinase domain-containing protein n=1 Tax=Paenibacillus sambharensis TaxID=1803190 RepID=A0A2W1LI08_9BACL|nr:hypothetical protein [Paenibacillus sambharensis]PZD94585.1 hypothetical protein DNH61_16590 [Paenibacillus sambharensis]